ncbi:response regulator transcription factor [Acetobacter sp.]|uniref:response regulator transcription factor n=1 Tax=Acetobacter sp. TaxID=440 RepID=UPI0025BB827D|nr:response regulator transcription factor [Acetobacter sp.]MCH4091417.1 response regulator transcription factor [Acetobacter sp.]MCI1299395.1 response regulator transcription factor [Acetobacter sp.]MCI1316601.1 response regulator transcription factor [Acetobacter sp.]
MTITAPDGVEGIRVLLVEDDADIAEEISAELRGRDFHVTVAETGSSGLEQALAGQYNVMIVDRMLPELDGLSLIEAVRQKGGRTPVLVLSALGAVDDRVSGLKAGGDDYLTKPFAMVELIARIEALLRRPDDIRQTILRVGPLTMDLIDRTVKRDGREIELLPREFRLLEYLMRRPGQILTRAMLLEEVWNYRFTPQTNLVDVHIGKLRRKVDASGEQTLIHSIRGAGFTLQSSD